MTIKYISIFKFKEKKCFLKKFHLHERTEINLTLNLLWIKNFSELSSLLNIPCTVITKEIFHSLSLSLSLEGRVDNRQKRKKSKRRREKMRRRTGREEGGFQPGEHVF